MNNTIGSHIIVVVLLLYLFMEVAERSTFALLVVILYAFHAFNAILTFVKTGTLLTVAKCVIGICNALK